jgi:hypothetical protein
MTELSLVELMEARVRRYRVWHRTAYTYGKPVQDSVGQFHLVPRGLPWQEVTEASVQVDPAPGDIAPDTDAFGNAATYFHLTDPHEALTITASSVVAVEAPAYDADALARPWEQARPMLNTHLPEAWRAVEYALESPRVRHEPEAAAYGAVSLTPGRPIGEAATDLMQRIYRDFDYDKTATTVTSTVADAMRARAGSVRTSRTWRSRACARTGRRALRLGLPGDAAAARQGAGVRRRCVACLAGRLATRHRPVARDRPDERPVGERPLRHGGVGPRLRRRRAGAASSSPRRRTRRCASRSTWLRSARRRPLPPPPAATGIA